MSDIIEGLWTCDCGHPNKARHLKCQSCGEQRGDDVEFYPPPDVMTAPAVTDPDQLAAAQAGPDWPCAYCRKLNPAQKDSCQSCGVQRGLGEDPEKLRQRELEREAMNDAEDRRREQQWEDKERFQKRLAAAFSIGGVIVAAIVAGILFHACAPRHVVAKVTERHWDRTVIVETSQLVQHDGWKGDVPSGADVASCATTWKRNEQVFDHNDYIPRTRQVIDHYEEGRRPTKGKGGVGGGARGGGYSGGVRSMGNGYFSRPSAPAAPSRGGSVARGGATGGSYSGSPYQAPVLRRSRPQHPVYRTEIYTETVPVYRSEPVYDQWCHYTVREWHESRRVPHSGSNNWLPSWPPDSEISLAAGERIGRKEEHYYVTCQNTRNASETWTLTPRNETEYLSFKVGDEKKLRIDRHNSATLE